MIHAKKITKKTDSLPLVLGEGFMTGKVILQNALTHPPPNGLTTRDGGGGGRGEKVQILYPKLVFVNLIPVYSSQRDVLPSFTCLLQFLVENCQLCESDTASQMVSLYRLFMDCIDHNQSFIFVVDNFFVPTHPKKLSIVKVISRNCCHFFSA